ncbi:clathrin light chain [Moniliophthora roreri]|uniref:Clathrin light chain n=1 Tax=Moniliophthora roreri TaxID=221103 RepID=A0A0W0GDJ1_MONRR|nr:clathrin light chain [Moniliophthora roreri]
MADFLKSDDEIDFDRAASAFPDISLDGEGDIPSLPSAPSNNSNAGFSFDVFDAPVEPVSVTGNDEIEKFESEFPDIEVPTSPPVTQPPPTTAFAPRPQNSFAATPILNQQIEEEEPEVIREWRAKQAEEIVARDESSKKRRQETISKAERSIDDFYEDYAAKKEKNIRENKDQEQAFLQDLTDSLSSGTTWDRICKLIELENSQSKTIARTGAGTTDLSRFKEVLLRLKREGDRAPGAGGY